MGRYRTKIEHTSQVDIAMAAFIASGAVGPRAGIVLRQGVRVLSDHSASEPAAATKEEWGPSTCVRTGAGIGRGLGDKRGCH